MKITPFKLERYYSLYEFTSKYSICNSDCEAMTIGELLSMEDGAQEKFNNHWLGYTETAGHPSLRKEIAGIYDTIHPNDMLVCTGAQEPIFLFCQANLNAGDDVIVQTPCYESLLSIPTSIGCTVHSWDVEYTEQGPSFSIQKLEDLVTEKTRVIFLNSPHNPTGYHFTIEEQQQIITIARKHNCIVFCDEVYRELELDISDRIPAFADAYEHGVSLGVMSKTYGLPGLRIGWIATKNKTILEHIAVLKEYTTICNSAPSEFLAGVGLRNRQTIIDRNLKIVKKNLQLFDDFFVKYEDLFGWYKPKAGPISFVKMKLDEDDKGFAERALKNKKLLLLPGWIYDYPGFFRVGFGRDQIVESLPVFEQFIEESSLHV